jgi:hypothetical protein
MSEEPDIAIIELEEVLEEIRSETIIVMYLMDQLNTKKKAIHELYEKERVLKSEMA